MLVNDFIKAEDIEIGEKKFRISCIPPCEAQEIFPKFIDIVKNNGELGYLMLPKDIMMRILKYTACQMNTGDWCILDGEKMINHFTDIASLQELQVRMIRKNFGFLSDGGLLKILDTGKPPLDSDQK